MEEDATPSDSGSFDRSWELQEEADALRDLQEELGK
jgi:hypothetical protein